MNSFGLSRTPRDALKELYGSFGDTVLYWAHHEKLCLVDRNIVFMGGLDMCMSPPTVLLSSLQVLIANAPIGFGRYDTNSKSSNT